MTIRYDQQVAIVTGAANGQGRSYAMALAARGAKVMVNDIFGAEQVVAEIQALGGTAMVGDANVSQPDEVNAMVDKVLTRWGRIDILVNNAAISRSQSFSKMSIEDFRLALDVNLIGAVNCCKAVWEVMKQQSYGRIVMTCSPSGVYGNYGHSSDATANMGLMGLMHVLHLEGVRYGVCVNILSPVVCSQLFGGLIDDSHAQPESMAPITAAMLYLVSDQAPARLTLSAGEGVYSASRTYETKGIYLPTKAQTPESIAQQFDNIVDPEGQAQLQQSAELSMRFISLVRKAQRSFFSRMPQSRLSDCTKAVPVKSDSAKSESSKPVTARPLLSRLWRANNG